VGKKQQKSDVSQNVVRSSDLFRHFDWLCCHCERNLCNLSFLVLCWLFAFLTDWLWAVNCLTLKMETMLSTVMLAEFSVTKNHQNSHEYAVNNVAFNMKTGQFQIMSLELYKIHAISWSKISDIAHTLFLGRNDFFFNPYLLRIIFLPFLFFPHFSSNSSQFLLFSCVIIICFPLLSTFSFR
jgi:hypothetical protein